MIDKMREAFEVNWDAWGWANAPTGFWNEQGGHYTDPAIQWAWQGYRAAQSPSQPLVEVQEPGLLQGRSRMGWGEEWGGWEEIPAGEWSIWRHRVENFPDGYELREWFAAPVRGLPLAEERIQAFGEEIDRDASAWPRFLTDQEKRVRLVRAVEAAHGISSSAPGGDGEGPK